MVTFTTKYICINQVFVSIYMTPLKYISVYCCIFVLSRYRRKYWRNYGIAKACDTCYSLHVCKALSQEKGLEKLRKSGRPGKIVFRVYVIGMDFLATLKLIK